MIGYFADHNKLSWAGGWLEPLLSLLSLIVLMTMPLLRLPMVDPATKLPGDVAGVAKTIAMVVPVWCMLEIDIVGDAPVTMGFMGLKWTMFAHDASRLLAVGGLVIGGGFIGFAWYESHRMAKKAAAGSKASPAVTASTMA